MEQQEANKMNQEDADDVLLKATALANKINLHIIDEPNFLVSYMAVALIKDTMDRAVPQEHRDVIDDLVHKTNESILIQKHIHKWIPIGEDSFCEECNMYFSEIEGDEK
jgi:hypothetical protein